MFSSAVKFGVVSNKLKKICRIKISLNFYVLNTRYKKKKHIISMIISIINSTIKMEIQNRCILDILHSFKKRELSCLKYRKYVLSLLKKN